MSKVKTSTSRPQSTVRIFKETKAEVQKVTTEKSYREKRRVTEIELIDPVIARWAAKQKRKLGII